MSGTTDGSKFNQNANYFVANAPPDGGEVIRGNLQVVGTLTANSIAPSTFGGPTVGGITEIILGRLRCTFVSGIVSDVQGRFIVPFPLGFGDPQINLTCTGPNGVVLVQLATLTPLSATFQQTNADGTPRATAGIPYTATVWNRLIV